MKSVLPKSITPVIFNDKTVQVFPLKSATQGCPLSLLLLDIVMKVLDSKNKTRNKRYDWNRKSKLK